MTKDYDIVFYSLKITKTKQSYIHLCGGWELIKDLATCNKEKKKLYLVISTN